MGHIESADLMYYLQLEQPVTLWREVLVLVLGILFGALLGELAGSGARRRRRRRSTSTTE